MFAQYEKWRISHPHTASTGYRVDCTPLRIKTSIRSRQGVVRRTASSKFACRLFKVRGCVVTYDRAAEPGAQTFTFWERRTSD